MTAVALLSPGEMGAAVGAQLVTAGTLVAWASVGRGGDTLARARAAGLTDLSTVAALIAASDVVLSVVPPQFAPQTAALVAEAGFGGLYLDANAIAPATVSEIAETVGGAGARLVDGGLVGGPPQAGRPVRLYLSGADAPAIAALFSGTEVDCALLEGGIGAASALKLAYAAWTKGSAALLLAAHELAARTGVAGALDAEWSRSQPDLADRLRSAVVSAERKGWRWSPEMEEIARAMADADLPSGFHQAAAIIFESYPHP